MKSATTLTVAILLTCSLQAAEVEALTAEQLQFFENRIRPILSDQCYECHSEESEKLKGSLLLDSRAGWMLGGESGQVILPGDGENSLIVRMLRHDPDVEAMPPKSKLKPDQIEDFARWIDHGAFDPRDQPVDAEAKKEEFNLEERKKWWSFQPINSEAPPEVKDSGWPQKPYDQFILAALEAKEWAPSARASKAHLLRRLSFDLIGLAPTREELEGFLDDPSPNAYAKQVDRLLASPHFGEKWARHWMDVVRYAETKAFEFDYTMPYAHRYRDYLIRTFNEDVPYDQFVLESFAGDLLENPRYSPNKERNESIQGPGFLFLTVGQHGPPDVHEDEARIISDVIDTGSKAYLGMTVACARCHDHKFDAITTGDYYSWYGMLRSSRIDIANSIPEEKQLAGESAVIEAEPEVRKAALQDAGTDVQNLSRYMEAARTIRESATYKNALTGYHAITEKRKKAPVGKKMDFDPEGSFIKALKPAVLDAAEEASLDSTVLQAWTVYLALPARHKKWPELEPLFRSLNHTKAPGKVAVNKGLPPLKQPGYAGFDEWMASGPAFKNLLKQGQSHYKYSTGNPQHTVQAILDSSNPTAGLYSSHLTGAIRSPDFVLDGKPVEIYARGKEATVRLIVRNYELAGRGPTTKILSVPVDRPNWHRVSIETKLWKGQPAYLEVIHGGNTTRALMPKEKLRPLSNDAFVSVSVDVETDWQSVWQKGDPAAVIAELWDKAASNQLASPERDILGALFGSGLIRAGADRSHRLTEALARYRDACSQTPEPHFVRTLTEGTPQDTPVFIRGSHKNLSKEPNPRRFLDGLGGAPLPRDRSGRLEFAEQMASETNPLVPRVIVNRIWHYLFGQGIVASVDDFGKLGSAPSHPKLLDYLAREFINDDWSIKTLIRELVTGSTYQMSSRPSAVSLDLDPDNVFLQHMPLKRMEAEQVRDHILFCSGELDGTMFGPSINAYVADLPSARGKPATGPLDGEGRRSIYLELRRNFLPSFLSVFGMPNATEATGRRNLTNVPSQALALMNSPFAHEQAAAWARRLLDEEDDMDSRIAEIHYSAFGRPPTEAETEWCHELIRDLSVLLHENPEEGMHSVEVWKEFCHVVMNRKEFIYLF